MTSPTVAASFSVGTMTQTSATVIAPDVTGRRKTLAPFRDSAWFPGREGFPVDRPDRPTEKHPDPVDHETAVPARGIPPSVHEKTYTSVH